MTIYLVIITTVLVITQIIRITQNAINLKNQNKVIDAQLEHLKDISEEDMETQREANRLIVEYLKKKGGE